MIARLTLRYLVLFAIVLAALSAGAYVFLGREYFALLGPAIGTAEASAAYAAAMRRVSITLLAFDVPLLAVFGCISWALARQSLAPLLLARDRERTFAADAAHALRSPLATIASVAQAQRAEASGRTAEALDSIAHAALDASAVVSDLLTLARSAQSDALEREPVDVAAVVNDVVREYATLAGKRGVKIMCEPAAAIVVADERRMRELTRNLLENALRHARSEVDVVIHCVGREAELIVRNDGEPIADEHKTKVFERFFRGDGDPGGSGLGLAIVAWVAKAHGGHASVRDADGGGAEFVVRLPLIATIS